MLWVRIPPDLLFMHSNERLFLDAAHEISKNCKVVHVAKTHAFVLWLSDDLSADARKKKAAVLRLIPHRLAAVLAVDPKTAILDFPHLFRAGFGDSFAHCP